MKALLLMLSLYSGIAGLGQGKLKTDITSNGDTLYSTGYKKIYATPGAKNAIGEIVKSNVYKSGAGFSLCLNIETGRTSVFGLGSDDVTEIAFTDGSLLSLRPNGDHNSKQSVLDYGWYIFIFYRLSDDMFDQLRSKNIQKITVFASVGRMAYEIKEKRSYAIGKQVMSFE